MIDSKLTLEYDQQIYSVTGLVAQSQAGPKIKIEKSLISKDPAHQVKLSGPVQFQSPIVVMKFANEYIVFLGSEKIENSTHPMIEVRLLTKYALKKSLVKAKPQPVSQAAPRPDPFPSHQPSNQRFNREPRYPRQFGDNDRQQGNYNKPFRRSG